jgi:hypothetical protein
VGKHWRPVAPWVALGVVVLVVAGASVVWVRALSAPVHRDGTPTATAYPSLPQAASGVSATGESTADVESSAADETPTPTPTATATAAVQYIRSHVSIPPTNNTGTRHAYQVEADVAVDMAVDIVAHDIHKVLVDPRSWAGTGKVRFSLVKNRSNAHFVISFNAAARQQAWCGKKPVCLHGKRVVISAEAWAKPPATYPDDLDNYQRYLINYGVGLYLKKAAEKCPGDGLPAPVMQPQWSNLKGCLPNPWVFT